MTNIYAGKAIDLDRLIIRYPIVGQSYPAYTQLPYLVSVIPLFTVVSDR